MLQIYENRRSRAHLEYVSKGLSTINKFNFTLFAAARCYWHFEEQQNLVHKNEILDHLHIFGFNICLTKERIDALLQNRGSFNDIIPCINIATRCLRAVTSAVGDNPILLDLRIVYDNTKISFIQFSSARNEMLTAEIMLERLCGAAPMEIELTNSEALRNAISLNSQRVRQNMQIIYGRL